VVPAWQSETESLLAPMITWTGHENVLIGLTLILAAVTLAQAIHGHRQRLTHTRFPHPKPTQVRATWLSYE
jgi:hypothetical protein